MIMSQENGLGGLAELGELRGAMGAVLIKELQSESLNRNRA
jgi:hypothetical protein